MSHCKHSNTRNKRKLGSLRELSQLEYQHLWPDLHRNPIKFAQFLRDYNAVVPLSKRVMFHKGKRGYLDITTVWRESLPVALQDKLDEYEKTLPHPFVRAGWNPKVIQGGLKGPAKRVERTSHSLRVIDGGMTKKVAVSS